MRLFSIPLVLLALTGPGFAVTGEEAGEILEQYCFDCHDGASTKGGLNLESALDGGKFDRALVFENLLTGKMPPSDKERPDEKEKRVVLEWLAAQREEVFQSPVRRRSRDEFVHALNDLLGTELELAGTIPDDRGTNDFDSNRRIRLSREMLGSYFSVTDKILDHAFPHDGFSPEGVWTTNKIRDSHEMYRSFHRPWEEGVLFSWTRSNNGISYSFFYDGFEPPEEGWYELTFEAAKVADFKDEMSLQVHAGRYYYADDRPQPQRLLGVISLGNEEVESRSIRAYLRPGESVSVHCFSRHNFREGDPRRGVYIKQMRVRGPLLDAWPPSSYRKVFPGLPVEAGPRKIRERGGFQTNLARIGGKVAVSSFEKGMEKEKLQDGSNLTFWHTRFTPTVAKPPHFVIFENPNGAEISGLSFATWQGGNGNGLVKAYDIFFSNDGRNWGEKVMSGNLDVRFANVQPVNFPRPTKQRFVKFLVTDAVSLDGKSIASVGRLDVVASLPKEDGRSKVTVSSESPDDIRKTLSAFAERAFSNRSDDEDLRPFFQVALDELNQTGDFVKATRVGIKAMVTSPRFLVLPGVANNESFLKAAELARIIWLSVPDDELLALAASDQLHGETLRRQIDRMLRDKRSRRMVRSFGDQWLNLRGWTKVTPSLKLYPLYDDLLDHYLPLETREFLHYLIQENLPVSNLIDSDFAFLNQRLARHYGIEGVTGQELRKVMLPPESPRGGLLTMGSILKVTTDGYETSPILRGAWISENIVGTPLSPPPESVEAIEPDHGEEAGSLREQIDRHKESSTCFACHKSIDPYGFALENFDASGQWRGRYRVKEPHRSTFVYRPNGYFRNGRTVDASGEINREKFADIFGLKKILLSKQRNLAYNFARKYFEYAHGSPPDLSQRLHLLDLVSEKGDRVRMKDLISAVLEFSLNQELK